MFRVFACNREGEKKEEEEEEERRSLSGGKERNEKGSKERSPFGWSVERASASAVTAVESLECGQGHALFLSFCLPLSLSPPFSRERVCTRVLQPLSPLPPTTG